MRLFIDFGNNKEITEKNNLTHLNMFFIVGELGKVQTPMDVHFDTASKCKMFSIVPFLCVSFCTLSSLVASKTQTSHAQNFLISMEFHSIIINGRERRIYMHNERERDSASYTLTHRKVKIKGQSMNRNKADYMLTAKKRRKMNETKTENVFVEGSECQRMKR